MRVSKLEMEKRVLTVQGWIIDGAQDDFIIRQIKTQWNVTIRQARRYLKKAYDNWKHDEDIELESKRSAKVAELQQLKRSLKTEYKGTPSGMNSILKIEKEIIRLEGLYVKKIDITTKGESINYTPIWGKVDSILDDKADNGS